MLQKESVEKNYRHNQKGSSPSLFKDIQEAELRHANRGSIMANIFERYTTEDHLGRSQLLSKDFLSMTREMDYYISGIPKNEREEARVAMMEHLEKRGYHGTH